MSPFGPAGPDTGLLLPVRCGGGALLPQPARCRWWAGWVVTSPERTALAFWQRLITAPELHLFFAPSRDEVEWLRPAQPCYATLGPQRIPMYTHPVPSSSSEKITGM
jgi:hypothetical protein